MDSKAAGAAVAEQRDNRMPPGIPFIVANEFAERFCFYGINAILSLYMVQFLHYGDAKATSWQSLFKFGAYFFPLVGAIVSDVYWGKFRTIISFSMAYVLGCSILALGPPSPTTLALGLSFMAFGTGGIKPCVSTNVGDQFTSRNQHLIERAFSYFYFSINAGSSISIWYCPVLLDKYGPKAAFGMPAAMMAVATLVFWLGRKRFTVVPPAGKEWLREIVSPEGRRLMLRLLSLLVFIAGFWALWEQSNGQTWTLQATSDLMDKTLWPGFQILPAQIQVVNGPMILLMIPLFTFVVYPIAGRFVAVTPLRKMCAGMFLSALSFLVIAGIENKIQHGISVSVWWQIFAYVVLSASEVLLSITALEFFYKQAPLRMKSFVMAMYLCAIAVGDLTTAVVNKAMVRELPGSAAVAGSETWVSLPPYLSLVTGQKVDFEKTGLTVQKADGKTAPLAGTFLVAEIQGSRVRLMDNDHRRPVVTTGTWNSQTAVVSTYRLVGAEYFNFFAYMMAAMGVIFIGVAMVYRERTYVRAAEAPAV
jgi:POT family proton-dependent oligopeptide transporter